MLPGSLKEFMNIVLNFSYLSSVYVPAVGLIMMAEGDLLWPSVGWTTAEVVMVLF